MILTFYVPFITIIILVIKLKGLKILANDLFWLILFWALITGLYFCSGIEWVYPLQIDTILYLLGAFFTYILFRSAGKYIRPLRYKRYSVNEKLNDSKIEYRINTKLWERLGYIGLALFTLDFIRLNSFANYIKSSYSISLIGSIGMIFVPILLVVGIYNLGYELKYYNKISVISIVHIGLYSVPAILNSGRESILLSVIALIVIIITCFSNVKIRALLHNRKFKKYIRYLAIIIIAAFIIMINISSDRYTNTEIANYLNNHIVPDYIVKEANSFGKYKFLYYNVLQYYNHQLPFFEILYHNYEGPYLMGLYQLNIISRRLPDSFGLDYTLAINSVRNMTASVGQTVLNGGWYTIVGSFIIDFGRVGAYIAIAILGFITGRVRRNFLLKQSVRYATLVSVISASMYQTICLSPFYNILVYGLFIWWLIIFKVKIK